MAVVGRQPRRKGQTSRPASRRLLVVRGRSQTPRPTRSRRDRARPAHDRRAGGGPLRARAQPRRQPHHRRHAALRAGDRPGNATAATLSGMPAGDAPTAEEIMRALETEQHAAAPTSRNGADGPAAGSLGAPTQHAAGSTRSPAARGSVLGDRLHRSAPASSLRSWSSWPPAPVRPLHGAQATPSPLTQQPRPRASALRRPDSSPMEHAADRNLGPARRRALAPRGSRATDKHPSTPRHAVDPPRRARPHHRPAAHPKRSIPRNSQAHQAPARPRAPRPQDQVKDLQRRSRTPRRARTRARAPPPHRKPPSAHSSQEPAPAAASSPHTSNAHRKVGST